jgi:hypothetical protein
MANMRIIYDNAADRATLQSTTQLVPTTPLTFLQNDVKSKVCRTTFLASGMLNITATWATPEAIDAVVLAFTNADATSTLRVVAYATAADTVPIYDKTVSAVKASFSGHAGIPAPVYASHWFDSTVSVGKLQITLASVAGTQVQAGRLIVGKRWTPVFGADQQGTTMSIVDMSEQFRTDSGDMYVNVKPQYRKQTLAMPSLDKIDRAKMWQVLYRNGLAKPLYISLYPENADGELEQMHQIYGRLVTTPVMSTPYFQHMAATIEIEEV